MVVGEVRRALAPPRVRVRVPVVGGGGGEEEELARGVMSAAEEERVETILRCDAMWCGAIPVGSFRRSETRVIAMWIADCDYVQGKGKVGCNAGCRRQEKDAPGRGMDRC